MRGRTLLILMASLLLPACGPSGPEPVGDIQLENQREEFFSGDVLRLRWNASNTERVYINILSDTGGVRMLSSEGQAPVGDVSIRVEAPLFDVKSSAPENIRFALMAPNPHEKGEFIMLDLTQNIEIRVGKNPANDAL